MFAKVKRNLSIVTAMSGSGNDSDSGSEYGYGYVSKTPDLSLKSKSSTNADESKRRDNSEVYPISSIMDVDDTEDSGEGYTGDEEMGGRGMVRKGRSMR